MSYVGQHIGRYRILEELGSGGMSVVYKGLDTTLEREVAIKVLHPHLARKDESRRRLQREARAVAKLNHPNILEIFDFSATDADEAYLVSEYIHGETLRQFAAREPFAPPEIACMVIHEIAAALAHAHEAGILHRDLKPENVMVRSDGILKLMDFGIAKIIDRDDRMTMTGALVGSPAHMAPEIVEGHEAGPEADVFSLGTMLYLFATGQLPFLGANTTATLKKILDGEYDDPRQVAPAISDELAAILSTSLATDPSARYPNAGKLRDALAEYLSKFGLLQIQEEVASFFADPPSYRTNLVPRLTQRLLVRARELNDQGRSAKALSLLNQTLALEPKNTEATALLKQMNAAFVRRQRLRTAARAALAVVIFGSLGFAVWGALGRSRAADTRVPDFLPLNESGAALRLPPSLFPTPEVEHVSPNRLPPAAQSLVGRTESTSRRSSEPKSPIVKRTVPSNPNRVAVTIKVRPFGWYRIVDTGDRSGLELSQHPAVELEPGLHRFIVGCSGCLEYEQEQEVSADGRSIHLLALSKPSKISFDINPSDAMVQIHTQMYRSDQTVREPIELKAKPGDLIGYRVKYEISRPGYQTVEEVAEVVAGEKKTVKKTLVAQ